MLARRALPSWELPPSHGAKDLQAALNHHLKLRSGEQSPAGAALSVASAFPDGFVTGEANVLVRVNLSPVQPGSQQGAGAGRGVGIG